MTLTVQFTTMIAMILSGFYLGVVRDTYLRFTRYWKRSIILSYFMEISFWLTQTFLIFYILYLVNLGELRLYIFLAILLGFAIYQVMMARLYRIILEWLISIVAAIIRFFIKIINYIIIVPIVFVLKLLFTCILFIGQFMTTLTFFLLKVLFSPIIWLRKLIFSLLPKKIQKTLHKLAGFYSRIKNIYKKIVNLFVANRRK